MSKSLPIELQFDDDGPLYVAQKKVYPQSVSGTFRRIKWGLMAFCLGSIFCCRSCGGIGAWVRRIRQC
jgi:hypothetical protein